MRRMTLMVLLGVGCSGSDNLPDASAADVYFADGATDVGFAPDADLGIPEPDRDNDGVSDEADNCPDQPNPQQENDDSDNFGNICDPCPISPHPPGSAADWCMTTAEQEPNDRRRSGQMIALPQIDRAIEITGNIEAATGTQAVDRFQVVVPSESLVHVTIRRMTGSQLEPVMIASGGLYRTQREAQGLALAERDLYFPSGGTYELKVSDRRGVYDNTPRGGLDFGYAVTIERLPLPENILNVGPGESHRIDVSFERVGEVAIYSYLGAPSNWTIQVDASPNFTAILAVSSTFNGQSGFYHENVGVTTRLDELLGVTTNGAVQRVILDRPKATTTEETVSIEFLPYSNRFGEEIEPNNNYTDAQALRNLELINGYIGMPMPDEDWLRYDMVAGTLMTINLGGFDPWIEAWRVVGTARVRDFTSIGSDFIQYAVPESATYYLRIADIRNRQPPYQSFGEQYYFVASLPPLAYSGSIYPPIQSSQNIRTRFQTGEPKIYQIPVEGLAVGLELTRTSSVPGVEPYMRLLGPDGKGIVAEDFVHIKAVLQPADFPYYLVVHDARRMGFSGELIDFSIDVVLTPQE